MKFSLPDALNMLNSVVDSHAQNTDKMPAKADLVNLPPEEKWERTEKDILFQMDNIATATSDRVA
jgi:hypothetical protein